MYSTYNEGKSVVTKKFIKMLKQHITTVSKNICFDVLDDIVDKYNNTYHRTIKMNPIDVDSNVKDANFKIGDHVRISKYKDIFAKGHAPNWFEVFVINKVKNTAPRRHVINDLNSKEMKERSIKKNCKRQIKQNSELREYQEKRW